MAIYRSLRNHITQNPRKSRAVFTVTAASLIPASPCALLLHCYSPSRCSRLLHPLPKWFVPFQGPLFLSSPPWKLLQSATPLYLGADAVAFSRVEALKFKLNFLSSPIGLPKRLGSEESVSVNSVIATDGAESKEKVAGRDAFLRSFVNFPNLISMARLASGPLLGWMIVNEMYSSAFVGLAISGVTDWLDGHMARRMKIDSVVGSYLDPLADKVLIGCVAVSMVHNDLLHPGLVGLVVFRDVALVGGALYHRAASLEWKWKKWSDFFNLDGRHPQKVEPLFISKINTVLQLVLVAGALLQPEFGSPETQSWITYLSWLVASTTMASTAAYGVQYMAKSSVLLMKKP